MKIYVNRNLLDLHGEKIKEIPTSPNQPVNEERGHERLGVMLVEGLLRDFPEDSGAGGGFKMTRFTMAKRIQSEMKSNRNSEHYIEMRLEDVNMIKQRLGKFLPTAILGPVYEAIDPDASEAESNLRHIPGN